MNRDRVVAFVLLCCSLALAACGDDDKKLELGGSCSLNSDCAEGLLCKFGTCHKACVKSVDCAAGERCLQVDGVAVCQMAKEQACDADGSCPAPLVCREADNTCRNTCSPTSYCLGGQVCAGGLCVEYGEADASVGVDAGPSFPDAPALEAPLGTDLASPPDVPLGGSCGLNSDCAEGLLCKFGACHEACVKSIDCATGERCVQVEGIAVCQMANEGACGPQSECPAPLVCRVADKTCRNKCVTGDDCLAGQTCSDSVCLETAEISGRDASVARDIVSAVADSLPVAPDTAIDSRLLSPDAGLGDARETGVDAGIGPILGPPSCAAIKAANASAPDGTYVIYPDGINALSVFCDMTTSGGGWTLFGNLVSGGFDYAAVTTTALGTAITKDNAFAAKPDGTVGRMRISGEAFQFEVQQSSPGPAYAPSMDNTFSRIAFDQLVSQSGCSVTLAKLPFVITMSKTGYTGYDWGTGQPVCTNASSFEIWGGHGSTIAGYTYELPDASGCGIGDGTGIVNSGVVWVPLQSPASSPTGGCGYKVKNTMEITEHYMCSNRATGVFATRVELYYR